MKKILYIIIILIVLIVIGFGCYALFKGNKKITISFNTNASQKFENLEIKVGESINLPVLEQSGYDFLGWYVENNKIDSNYKFNQNTVVTAKWEKHDTSNNDQENDNPPSNKNEIIVYCGDPRGEYKCYTEKEFHGNDSFTAVSMPCNELSVTINKSELDKGVIKTNSSNAKYLTNNLNFILYRDGDTLKIFDIKKNITIKEIPVDANLKEYKLHVSEDNSNVIGLGYVKNGYIEYYNILNNKFLYEKKYKGDSLFDLNQVNDHSISLQQFEATDNDVYLLSIDEEKVLLSDKTNSGTVAYKSYGKEGKYIYGIEYTTQKVNMHFRIYLNNMKPLFSGNGFKMNGFDDYARYINMVGDYIYILDGDVVKKYDYNGKLLSTSKKYNNPRGLINRLKRTDTYDNYKMQDNYIVYEKNDNLLLENTENSQESIVITKLKDRQTIGLLSYYTKAEANKTSKDKDTYEEGIYISVTEPTNACKNHVCNEEVIEYCYTKDKKVVSYPSYSVPVCIAHKPLIYLYPEKEMDVEVKLGNISDVTTIYPRYNNGWNVKAYPNGKLIDKKTKRELYGLY